MGLNLFQVDQNVSALSLADLHLGINKKWRYSEMTENAMQKGFKALKDMVCTLLALRPRDDVTFVTIVYEVDLKGLLSIAKSFISRIISREPYQGFSMDDNEVEMMQKYLYTSLWIRYSFLFDKKAYNAWTGHDKTNVLQGFEVPAFWSCWLSAIGSLDETRFGIKYVTKIEFDESIILDMQQFLQYQRRISPEKYGLNLVPITGEVTGDPDFLTCFLGCSEEVITKNDGNEKGVVDILLRVTTGNRLYSLKEDVAPGVFILAAVLRPHCYKPGFSTIGHYFGTVQQAAKELDIILDHDKF